MFRDFRIRTSYSKSPRRSNNKDLACDENSSGGDLQCEGVGNRLRLSSECSFEPENQTPGKEKQGRRPAINENALKEKEKKGSQTISYESGNKDGNSHQVTSRVRAPKSLGESPFSVFWRRDVKGSVSERIARERKRRTDHCEQRGSRQGG